MSDAIWLADAAESDYMDACVGSGGGDSEDRIRVILDAATADVEGMARVLSTQTTCDGEPHPTELHRRQAQAIRDWMLGEGGA